MALAADLPLPDAERLYQAVHESVGVVKVGLSLFVEHGPQAVAAFTGRGAKVFLDLKLHDIPHTVEAAARHAGRLGASFLTVHAAGGEAMIRAAVSGSSEGARKAGYAPPKILAVTVLTSLSDRELEAIGFREPSPQTVERLARLAMRAGADGVVCSPREARSLRVALGPEAFLCTPGIRPEGAGADDQARAQTPQFAARAGSNLLVVGRPIYEAADPSRSSAEICAQIAAAI